MERKVFDIFKNADIYLVGGIVRDRLLGRESNDYDFAINLEPEVVEQVLNNTNYKTYDIGKAFGTISFMLDGNKVEITTFRKNEKYQRDNRRPVVEWGKSINDDLIRRDFTFNAMALDRDGKVIDLFNGAEHLKNGIIDTPMDPQETFNDDPLRMLRAVRFRSRFGFKYSDRVREALKSQAYRLLWLPHERILDELNKILLGEYVKEALEDLMDYKLFNYIIPELTVLKDFKQESEYHHKDVWAHTLGVASNTPADLTLRWVGLLHDIGKPYVYSCNDGKTHFYHHEDVSALLARSITERMGLPRKVIEDIVHLVKEHMRTNLYNSTWSDSAVRRFMKETQGYTEQLLSISRADITSHRPQKVQFHLDLLNDLRRRMDEMANFKELKCPLKGDVIMKYFNLTTGPRVGELKDLIMEALTNGDLNLGENDEVYLKYLETKV